MAYFNKLSAVFSSDSLCNEALYRAEIFRFLKFVCHDHCDQLGYAGKQKISMKRFCVLCLAVSEAETVLDVIDGTLD